MGYKISTQNNVTISKNRTKIISIFPGSSVLTSIVGSCDYTYMRTA